MRLDREQSQGSSELLNLAQALIDYNNLYGTGDLKTALLEAMQRTWPRMEIYKGHTHWRVSPFGAKQPFSFVKPDNFYVDLTSLADYEAKQKEAK